MNTVLTVEFKGIIYSFKFMKGTVDALVSAVGPSMNVFWIPKK